MYEFIIYLVLIQAFLSSNKVYVKHVAIHTWNKHMKGEHGNTKMSNITKGHVTHIWMYTLLHSMLWT